MVANLTALNEFRRDRRDHAAAAMGAAHGGREVADGGELRSIGMKLHVVASFLFARTWAGGSCASWQARDTLVKVSWPERQTFVKQNDIEILLRKIRQLTEFVASI
jgi:hypothetical protein